MLARRLQLLGRVTASCHAERLAPILALASSNSDNAQGDAFSSSSSSELAFQGRQQQPASPSHSAPPRRRQLQHSRGFAASAQPGESQQIPFSEDSQQIEPLPGEEPLQSFPREEVVAEQQQGTAAPSLVGTQQAQREAEQESSWQGSQLYLRWLGLKALVVPDDGAHRQLVQTAFREQKLSFGFSGGGTLYPYYIGVVGALRDGGVLADWTKVGGASAGSLIAAVHQCGMELDFVVEQCMRFMHELRAKGTRGRLGAQLCSFLQSSLPQDAHERCRDKAYVAVTQAYPVPRGLLVSQFEDRDDLISALRASCHIPYYLDGQATTEFRGVPCVDGGLTKFIPLPPQTVGIRVCCFPSKQLNPYYRIGISPDNYEPWPYTLGQMLQYAFDPADEKFVTEFIEKGKRDAQAWMEQMGLAAESQAAEDKARGDTGEVASAKQAAQEGARQAGAPDAAPAA
ncbi:hypothetical protein N2152v2_003421 [Parachlorella kessleri]